jgi:hypothetical protein
MPENQRHNRALAGGGVETHFAKERKLRQQDEGGEAI